MRGRRSTILLMTTVASACSLLMSGCAQNEAASTAARASLKSPAAVKVTPAAVPVNAAANAGPAVAKAGFDRRPIVVEEHITEHVHHKPVHVDEATYIRRRRADRPAE